MKKMHNILKSQKLLKISLEYDELTNTIHSITITGDFFLYPESTLDDLETNLIGTKLEKESVKQKIQESLENSETFGFDPESLTEAILGCLSC
jgi:lipoate-protein ligase A